MKKAPRLILIIILVAVSSGIVWWQLNKKGIIRSGIEKAVARGTDSTYYIHYDSSRIDELAGNATFYNVVLQSDSLQQQLYTDDTTEIPRTIFNVRIARLTILGANIPAFLQKNKIEANEIEIEKPVITLINTGKEAPVKFTAEDTLAIYEKLTGKFKSIQAGEIRIIDGTIAFARGKKSPHATLQGVNVDLRNLKIDSTRNYDNLVSYFIKDVVAKVQSANIKNDRTGRLMVFDGIEYNAPGRFLMINNFLQKDIQSNKTIIALQNNRVIGLSTNAFIINRVLKADSLNTDGGELGIYSGKKNSTAGKETIEIDNNFFDEAIIKNIRLGSTTLSIINRNDKNAVPLIIRNLKFNAFGIDSAYRGTDVMELIAKSNWDLSGAGVSFITKDKVYRIDIGAFMFDNFNSSVTILSAAVVPLIRQDAFVKSLKFQKDLYELSFKNIRMAGADVKKLMTDRAIMASDVYLEPTLRIFNDRTVLPDTVSKIGQYPHQLLQKLSTPVYIKTLHATNGLIFYRERGALSKKTGDVVFNNVNGTVSNFTNIASFKKKNDRMTMAVNCLFLNKASISSQWNFPLNAGNGAFSVSGKVGSFNGTMLNPVIEPLGMGSIKSGSISSYNFEMTGDDLKADGTCVMIYKDLKVKLLKNEGDSNRLEKKKALSLVANVFIKDKNEANGSPRKGNMSFKRVTTKTFFNLVWKSIFAGAKSSTKPI